MQKTTELLSQLLIKISFLALLLSVGSSLAGQEPPATQEEFEKRYQQRIQKEFLAGVYIPKDLQDAFQSLDQLVDKESKLKFQSVPEDTAAVKLHFSLGRWMIYNWGFYEGSRLSHYLRSQLAIFHPDDMARFLIIAYHRHLNEKPLEIKALVERIHEKQKREKKDYLKGGEIIHREKRKPKEGGQ